jgi:DNA-binding transcriptional LysR family regulator
LADAQISELAGAHREQVRLRAVATALAGFVPSTDGFLIRACRDAGFEPRVVSTTRDPVATRGLIARGLGVGWVPSLLVDDYAGVAIRPLGAPVGRRDIYALLPPGRRHPLAGRVVRALSDTDPEFAVV